MSIEPILRGIRAAVDELIDDGGLVDQLADLMAERSQSPEIATSRRPPSSRPPWDGSVAEAAFAIHAAARDMEAELRAYVFGRYVRRTGGSTGNTRMALRAVADLVFHDAVPESEVRRVAGHLGKLIRAAQSVPAIDLAPAPPATLRPPCPHCGTGSLQAALDGSTEIHCVNPKCLDPVTGASPRWPRHRWPFLLSRLVAGTS